MNLKFNLVRFICAAIYLLALTTSYAQLNIPYNNKGSDGVFDPTNNYVIDLSAATTGNWEDLSTVPGNGVYDATKWAVIFKFSSVNIRPNVTITFKNHPSRAPVVWLVDGTTIIGGSINLSATYPGGDTTEPGPGGFRAGRKPLVYPNINSGFGPGGGYNGAGSYNYGNTAIIPLVGGSGASAGWCYYDFNIGGAGAGAILICSKDSVTVNGSIIANSQGVFGCTSPGSGGAIRLVASQILGSGSLQAYGGTQFGRIRLQAFSVSARLSAFPDTVRVDPTPLRLWPDSNSPDVRIVSVAGTVISGDPRASLDADGSDVTIQSATAVDVVVETRNFSTNGVVTTRIVPKYGNAFVTNASFVTGNTSLATWRVTTAMPQGFAAIQVRGVAP